MAEVYGTSWLEDERDLIVAQMEALKISMATGYDPTFSYVYDTHGTADIKLNAVTVGLAATPEDRPMWAQQHTSEFFTEWSIRIHTAYAGDNILIDEAKNSRLANSIINKLQANRVLTADSVSTDIRYRIDEITGASVADEFGLTTGGEVRFIVTAAVQYTQE